MDGEGPSGRIGVETSTGRIGMSGTRSGRLGHGPVRRLRAMYCMLRREYSISNSFSRAETSVEIGNPKEANSCAEADIRSISSFSLLILARIS